jgi:type III secretion system chaperone SycN
MVASFSTTARRVIESFAANMGVTARAAADQSYGFEFARSGRLSIVPSEDGARVIICLARVPHRADASTQRRLFDQAGFDPASSAMVHAGVAPDGTFVLALNLEEERFDMQLLDEALSMLSERHDSIG